ncbi:hypothetical protein EMIT0347P_10560 [Pseudomonas sp. IT-347P]
MRDDTKRGLSDRPFKRATDALVRGPQKVCSPDRLLGHRVIGGCCRQRLYCFRLFKQPSPH